MPSDSHRVRSTRACGRRRRAPRLHRSKFHRSADPEHASAYTPSPIGTSTVARDEQTVGATVVPAVISRPPYTRRDAVGLILLILLAGGLRFFRLAEPQSLVFDETYYAKDACLFAGFDQDFCDTNQATEQSWVHPPLGKWLIAGGIKLFGYNSFGWRFSAALFGTLLVALVYILARKLFRTRWTAGVAGFLVATDLLLIVQSRIAMLDIFVAFFVVLGFIFLAFDRERILLLREHHRFPFYGEAPQREPEWRVLAGAAFGLAIAVKWAAVWALLAAIVLAVAWSVGLARIRKQDPDMFLGAEPTLLREFAGVALSFGVVPLVTYLLSYIVWFSSNGLDLAEFLAVQGRMLEFHSTLEASHSYQSEALTWPLVLRPIAYFWEGEPQAKHILAFGNPATWWVALIGAVWLGVRSFRKWRAERFVAAAWFVQYGAWVAITAPVLSFYIDEILFVCYLVIGLPWIAWRFIKTLPKIRLWPGREIAIYCTYLFVGLVGLPLIFFYLPATFGTSRSAIFFFYMTPIVPFMMIGLAAALTAVRRIGEVSADDEVSRIWRLIPVLYLVVATLLMVFLLPVATGIGLDKADWANRMWLDRWI